MALRLGPQRDWVKKMAIQHRVVPHIERAIDQLGEFEWTASFGSKVADDAWHPSGDCMSSLHDLYLKAIGDAEAERIGGSLRKIFAVGHFWHAYLQEIMVRADLTTQANVERRGMTGWGPVDARHLGHVGDIPWMPWHWSTGLIDIADCDIPGHGVAVVDFKTMNTMDFKRNAPPERFGDKWECQLNIYMDWTGCETAFIIGIDKGTPHSFKEFMYDRNQPLIDAIYAKWQLVSSCVTEGVTPPLDEEWPMPLKGPK
jgi:hypothetical protein